MIIEIENRNGSTIGACRLTDNNEDGFVEIFEMDGAIDYADSEPDYIFDTNEELVRIQLQENQIPNPFRSGNHIGFYHKNEHVKGLMQERASYKALLNSFERGDYYDCGVLIENYFGHINYAYQFGYVKSHAEIVGILHSTLLAQLSTNRNDTPFTNFITRQINKIEWNLKNDYGIKDIEQCYKDGWLP